MRPRATSLGAILVAVAVFPLTARPIAQEKAIDVFTGRPLHAAIKEMERRFGVVITYEDSPYLYSNERVDVTQARGLPNDHKKVFDPRSVRLTVPVTKKVSSDGDVLALLRQVVAEYNRITPTAVFEVSQDSAGLHVAPRQVLDKEGKMHIFKSSLAAGVNVPDGNRTAAEAIEAILNDVSLAGERKVLFATASPSIMDAVRVSGGFRGMSAQTAIENVVALLGEKRSWQLLCDPSDGGACYFSVTIPGRF